MTDAWNELAEKAEAAKSRRIEDLFADPERAARFSASALGLHFDYSKTALDEDAMAALIELAEAADLAGARKAMFSGEKINTTEDRAVLHTALRNLDGGPILVDGKDVMPEVRETHDRMAQFAEDVRAGRIKGQGGAITDVVNIGIGGSDLGPVMAVQALAPYHDGPRCHFISNVDGADATDTLKGLDPARTLVIVASKTFTTIETMTNAQTVRRWMAQAVAEPAAQFAALSTAEDLTAAFGIAPERVFGFEDWVGGRYSVWGPIGLSLMIAIGAERFDDFLAGGAEMDAHFREAPLAANLPVLLALTGIWHNQGLGYATRAVLPYEQRLLRLPAYLQQLEMESNGKRVTKGGEVLERASGPIVWGEPGTNGQHAFYQLLHQGTQIVPCEFMVGIEGHEPELRDHHILLQANCLAQSEAMMRGRGIEAARAIAADLGFSGAELERQAAQRVFEGNRPSVTLIYPRLSPRVLGQIVALYEHRVFVEGVILGINSFDQWGVELGKELAKALEPVLRGDSDGAGKDGSTLALAKVLRGS
ncbi:glucose-6-phosphate isomerase [Rhodalgimonas zhirmunskyi]|uniref:Glucose-6-phosphate isomerase n=1 Tax=Rhodalgimonas zhirmunskyi TaxID=2964767 RepID=A0AAJ1X5N4_9RHOB|nr:glucose-6-phosphate isomerase [Rhodoalgimonas zhirmunskyi]MDQ2092572.1 glucose-6-phosphate isomerase [Rhodoalgimonas zhirmunskyi]